MTGRMSLNTRLFLVRIISIFAFLIPIFLLLYTSGGQLGKRETVQKLDFQQEEVYFAKADYPGSYLYTSSGKDFVYKSIKKIAEKYELCRINGSVCVNPNYATLKLDKRKNAIEVHIKAGKYHEVFHLSPDLDYMVPVLDKISNCFD